MSSTAPTPGPPLNLPAIDALLLDTTPYLSCDGCFEQVDSYVEALVHDPAHENQAMETHLRGCRACTEEADGLVQLLGGHAG
ncbi:MAG: hypothetical protein ABIU87_07895 [Ornithinibacter sp.]